MSCSGEWNRVLWFLWSAGGASCMLTCLRCAGVRGTARLEGSVGPGLTLDMVLCSAHTGLTPGKTFFDSVDIIRLLQGPCLELCG